MAPSRPPALDASALKARPCHGAAQVKLSTYYGKWSSCAVDFAVCWQPSAVPGSASLLGDGAGASASAPAPAWETRQVVAHSTKGEAPRGVGWPVSARTGLARGSGGYEARQGPTPAV
jgi:hypothetical protein